VTLSADAPVSRSSLASDPEAKVEIVLKNGRQLAVPANVAPEALARLLPVLERT